MRLNTDENLKLFELIRACRTLTFVYEMTTLDYDHPWIQTLAKNVKKEMSNFPMVIPPEGDPEGGILL